MGGRLRTTGKVIYVLSDNRSGSTLLDQLLGANADIVSLGEVHHLPAYVLNDRSIYDPVHSLVCSCGNPVTECEFWKGVAMQMGRSLDSLRLKPRFYDRRGPGRGFERLIKGSIKKLLSRWPKLRTTALFRSLLSSRKVGKDSFELFDAIFAWTGAEFLVDSSKDPFRMRNLYDYDPDRIVVVMLARDVRGIAHSKMKRGRDIVSSVKGWTSRMNNMKAVVEGIPHEKVIRMKYEDLCADPKGELQRVCDVLNIDFAEEMLTRPSASVHHLGGSPSKFDPSRRSISVDQAYVTAFSDEQLRIIKDIAGDAAGEWGYDLD